MKEVIVREPMVSLPKKAFIHSLKTADKGYSKALFRKGNQ